VIALQQFRERYEQLKHGTADGIACWQLIREICAHAWRTVDERNAAQRLVNEVERLRRDANPG
jgi:hypothetical protein